MEWINVKEKLPEIGEMTKCKVEFWRFNQLHHIEEREAIYTGFEIAGHPMWNIDSGDEAFARVTYWLPLLESPGRYLQ